MRYKTVEDILAQAGRLHGQAAQLAEQAAAEQDQQRLALVLDYLADHQVCLQQAINSFRSDATSAVLATWFDRTPELELPDFAASDMSGPDSVDALIDATCNFHDRLIELYANLRDQSPVDDVRAVFADLAELERHEKMELVQGTRQLQDF